MEDVLHHAAELGLRVVWRDLGRDAGRLHSSGVVYLNPRRSVLTQRMTLAHEVGHHALGHDWTRAHDVDADERAADTYAARILIPPIEYRHVEQIYGSDPRTLAGHLGVTARLVALWQAHHHRRGNAVRMEDAS